jgi:hypothetical protein
MPKMWLNIYGKWKKNRNATFISLLEFSSKAKVVDLGYGDENSH